MFTAAEPVLEVSAPDRLGVLKSTLPVVRAAPQAILSGARVAAIAAEWSHEPWPEEYWDTHIHFFDGTERTLNWMALLDALNFCFWGDGPTQHMRGEGSEARAGGEGNRDEHSESSHSPSPGETWEEGQEVGPRLRWRVVWRGQWYNGYDALAVALTRALDDGYPLWDAGFLMRLDAATLGHILRPDPDDMGQAVALPLLPARLANAREVGRVLHERYDGQFANVVTDAHGDAVALALTIASAMPSFDDVAQWQGAEVRFFKRAQILVGDIAAAFDGQGWGEFTNLGDLTAFADYKVPQLLRRLGILDYAPDLAARIDRYAPIPAGSPDEVAIRAATIWGVEWLRQALAARGTQVTAAAIDHRLWLAGQTSHPDDRQYHRTRTLYY
jgi:hypothetical protein